VSVHSVAWRINCSAIDDEDIVKDALSWLVGEDAVIEEEVSRSHHGATQRLLKVRIEKRRASTEVIARLGTPLLSSLTEDEGALTGRIDEERVLHLRLDLGALACGKMQLLESVGSGAAVKGRIKLEVYPTQSPIDIARELLNASIAIAENRGWIGIHDDAGK